MRDRVDKEGLVALELRRIAVLLDHVVVMRLRERALRRQRLVGAREEREEVAGLRPGGWTNGVARPVGHRQVTGFDVNEQRGGRIEVLQARGLADAALAEQQQLHATALGHARLGADDGEPAHAATSSRVSVNEGLPGSAVRASANCWRSAGGQLL